MMTKRPEDALITAALATMLPVPTVPSAFPGRLKTLAGKPPVALYAVNPFGGLYTKSLDAIELCGHSFLLPKEGLAHCSPERSRECRIKTRRLPASG